MNLVHLLLRSARWLPERPALAIGKRVVRDLRRDGARASRGLLPDSGQSSTSSPGDRVALAMKNCPEYYEILFACWHAGLTAVPMNAKLHPKEFAYILENSGAKACFATPDLEAAVPGGIPVDEIESLLADPHAPADVEPDDVAWLFYTSGTTGVPKGAMLTHRNMLFQTQAYFADIDKLGPQDAALHPAPLSHGSGLYGLPHFAAGAVNVIPESGHFEPAEIFELLDHWPNALVLRRADHDRAPAREPRGAHAAEAEDHHLRRRADVRRRLPARHRAVRAAPVPALRPGRSADDDYRPAPGNPSRRKQHLETCGFARTGVEVKIFDDGDRELPPGEVGEIVTRSDCVMAGYWKNPEATAKALRGGWLHTGDVGSLDAEGFLTIKDRSKDMIISGGANIYPREIEEVLLRHPAVAECSVVGRPHPEWGEEVVAFIVTKARLEKSTSWTPSASTTSRASSGRGNTASSTRCRRTTTARC